MRLAGPLISRVPRAAGLLAGCALLFGAVPASALTGVSVDLGRIEITEQLAPGSAYNLPLLGVRNPGTETADYVMVASPVPGDGTAVSDASWFRFEPTSMTLGPGEIQRVRIRLVLPTDAAPGEYTVLVGAQLALSAEGPSTGAGAAARTTFSIEPSSGLEAVLRQLGQSFTDLLPWSALAPAAVGLGLLALFLRRRFMFRIGIERRGRPLPGMAGAGEVGERERD